MRSLRELIMGTSQPDNYALERRDCTVSGPNSPTMKRAKCRIEVLDGINGKVLEVATRAEDHDDWDIDLYIVRDDEALADAIATMLVLKGGR
ncbi:hypothetical protein UFOVP48_15 [uncultured Caudovirales phage]|uniref:Uncharacterized protein n=1 Tax=uncultured Caudovirales phage TaxID=2100421 RepID=A0A6J5KTQ7_9CAUD|nr:hypothetical protein UFOVP48_15 [uncultured Caudovirales phage]